MRIITGKYKGSFPGKAPDGVRPTQDAMRETIFNLLYGRFELQDAVVADICAGTGALGIEALSRGAAFVYFVDNSKKSIAYLKSALEHFKIPKDNYKVVFADGLKFLNNFKTNYPDTKLDLLLTDPPYADTLANSIVAISAKNEIISENGVILAEYGSSSAIMPPAGFEVIAERSFTMARITLLENVGIEAESEKADLDEEEDF